MSGILKMKSFPILNITDFYKQFDVLDAIRNREACLRFALGHFKWSNSINLHHIDVLKNCCTPDVSIIMGKPSDYWNSDGKGLCRNPCDKLVGYNNQERVVEKIYTKYKMDFSGEECRILMLVIAIVLLGNQTERCLQNISAKELRLAYKKQLSDHAKTIETERTTNAVTLSFRNPSSRSSKEPSLEITLPHFAGSFRLPINPNLRPSSTNRLQTWVIQATAKSTLELYNPDSGKVVDMRKLEPKERLYCLVLNETLVKVLPNVVKNGDNTLERKIDGIYLNGIKFPGIPIQASSFAIGTDVSSPWILYVCNGRVKHLNSDGIGFRRKVSEQINVIAEVCVVNKNAVIVRNDGMIWGGDSFIVGGVAK